MDARIYSVEKVNAEALNAASGARHVISVSAHGTVNSSGWTHPRLSPWIYIDPPKDEILDLDFIATAPTGIVLFVMSPIMVGLTFEVPAWVHGVRIHSATGTLTAMLERAQGERNFDQADQGTMGPSPFPWQSPETVQ